jgi:hypothetical protein
MRLAALLVLSLAAAPLAAQERTISVGQTASGELRTTDPIARNRKSPYHLWTFDGRRGQRIQIDMRSRDFDSYLVLRDDAGFILGSDDDSGDDNDARVHTVLPRDGRYTIVATGFSEAAHGAYTLSVTGWEAPEASAPGAAGSINVGQSKDGMLEPGDEIAGDGPLQDRWTFNARAGQRLRVDMHSADFDSYIVVLGPDGAQLGSDDDGGEGNDASLGIRAVAGGTYTILATSYGDNLRIGAYRLTLAEESGNFADPGVAATIATGETKEGRLETGDPTGTRGMQDGWTFRGTQGQMARIDVISTGFDSYATLYFNGMPIDSNDDGGDGNNARLMTLLPGTGIYTVQVSQYGSGGSGGRYTIGLAISDAPPGAGRIERITVGQRVSGRLEAGDRPRSGGGYQDVWEFDGREGQDVTIELHSGDFDSYLELRDDMGAQVAEDDDSGEGNDAMILTRLPRTGRYRIIARSYGEREAAGFYELALSGGGEVVRPGRAAEIREDQTLLGRLEQGDVVVGDSTFADEFTFRAPRDGQVVVDLRSGDFDAYLLVKDQSGATLATDDDGGDGTNSRVTIPVRRGQTYRIFANSYGEDRAAGLYRLSLRYAHE